MANQTLNVRISGSLQEHVARATSDGDYENVSEYVRDLIRKDKTRAETAAYETLKAEISLALAAPDDAYEPLTPEDIFAARKKP